MTKKNLAYACGVALGATVLLLLLGLTYVLLPWR